MGDDFQAIVVGAGMAGAPAAIRLAQAGVSTLLLERGPEAGSKNLSGGILWGRDLDAILPNWSKEMPVERPIVRKRFGLLGTDGAVSLLFDDPAWKREPRIAHAVLRARTDGYLAAQAEAAGATVVTGVPVDRLCWEGTRVRGVVQGGETMTAPITIVADGANSRLSLGSPIRPATRLEPATTELGIKEVWRLPAETIEERFHLAPGEGHAEEWVLGCLPEGVMGGGFLYTNHDTLSVGIILNIGSLYGRGAYSQELIERFRLHPAIAPFLAEAELVEYGAKLISSGWASRPAAFSGDGWMVAGDAAGFVFSNGVTIQGMNYAVRTGLLAAETAIAAVRAGDVSARQLRQYDRRLEERHVLPDFRDLADLDRVKWNPRLYGPYARMLLRVVRSEFGLGDGVPRPLAPELWRALQASSVTVPTALRDALDFARHL